MARIATTIPVITKTDQLSERNPPTLVLELNSTNKNSSHVHWSQETIDNEHLNRKKSKCCCIYTKPHDPQSNDDQTKEEYDNCQHCRFHTASDYSAEPNKRQPKIKLVVRKQ